MKNKLIGLILSAALASMSVAQTFQTDDEFISKLVKKSTFAGLSISPSGDRYALTHTDENDIRNLYVFSFDGKLITKTSYDRENVYDISWLNNDRVSFKKTLANKFGIGEEMKTNNLIVLDLKKNKTNVLWGVGSSLLKIKSGNAGKLMKEGSIHIGPILPDDPDRVLALYDYWYGGKHQKTSVYSLDVNSGASKLYARTNVTEAEVAISRNGQWIVANGVSDDYEPLIEVKSTANDWAVLKGFDKNLHSVNVLSVSNSGMIYATVQNKGAVDEPIQFVAWNINTGKKTVLASSVLSDISHVHYDEKTQEPVYVVFNSKFEKVKYLQPKHPSAVIYNSFKKQFHSEIIRLGASSKGIASMFVGGGNVPGERYLVDLNAKSAKFLYATKHELDPNDLYSYSHVSWESSDGMTINGWLTMPRGVKSPPLIVQIHGGPHGPYVNNSFDAEVQLLAHHGYAVLQPNFRGSGGQGQNFLEAGYGEWGRAMIDDMKTGADALISKGVVSDQVCVMGGSYGGYATAMSLVRHANFYKCGVAVAGMFGLEELKDSSDIGNLRWGDIYMERAFGDESLWSDYSPIKRVGEIKAPIYIFHGTKDKRTPFKGAELMVDALDSNGIVHEKKYYVGEGHGFANEENRVDYYSRLLKFIDGSFTSNQ